MALNQYLDPLTWPIIIRMDSGVFSISASPTPPMLCYTGPSIQSYIAGSGTTHPTTASAQWLIGPTAKHTTQCYNWPVTPPVLDSNNAYPGHAYRVDNTSLAETENDPNLYTGLLRLAVQAKLGAGRQAAELCPWPLDGDTVGLHRSDNYVYHIISVTSSGCTARRLKTDMTCIQTWLADAKTGAITIDASDIVRLEAWLMSGLVVDETSSDQALLTDAQLDGVLGGGRQALAYGWKFSRGWINEASIVTVRDGDGAPTSAWYHECTLATISFAFDAGDNISAMLSVTEQDTHLSIHTIDRMWYPVLNNQVRLTKPSGHAYADVSSDGPLYCFYTDSGLQVLRYQYDPQGSAQSDPGMQVEYTIPCSGGLSHSDSAEWALADYVSGGFTLGSVTAQEVYSAEKHQQTIDIDVSEVGEVHGACNLNIYTLASAASTCGQSVGTWMPAYYLNSCGTREIKAKIGTFDWVFTDLTVRDGGNFSRMAIITGDNPEGCYVLNGWTIDYDLSTTHRYANGQDIGDGRHMYWHFGTSIRLSDAGGGGYTPYYNNVSCTNIATSNCSGATGYSESVDGTDPDGCATSPDHEIGNGYSTESDISQSISGEKYSGYLVTSAGNQKPVGGSWSDWNQFYAPTATVVSNRMPLSESFGGDLMYYEHPGSKVPASGYDSTAGNDARNWAGFV